MDEEKGICLSCYSNSEHNTNCPCSCHTKIEQPKPKKKSGKYCRNPDCKWKIIEYPIWEGQEEEKPFEFKKIKWYNLLIGDWTKTLVIFTVLLMAWAYWHDTQAINQIYENPCAFVEKNIQPCNHAKQNNQRLELKNNGTMIWNINYTSETK